MCGIIAYSGPDVQPVDIDDFKILMLFSEQRGDEASGYGLVNECVKDNSRSSYFITKNKIPSTNLIIGHTRNPSRQDTKGEENAQPFDYENLIGLHNGYINTSYDIRRILNTSHKLSDSYHALKLINDRGLDEAMNDIDGSYAFMWIDKKSNELNLLRRKKPTFYGRKNKGLYFASEFNYLEAIDCKDIQQTETDYLYTVKDGEISKKDLFIPKTRGYTRSTQDNYCGWGSKHGEKAIENEKKHEGAVKIEPDKAPADAKRIWINGNKHYYWVEEDVLFVEVIKRYNDTSVSSFALTYDASVKEAYKQYKPIVNKVLDDYDPNTSE